LRLIFKGGGLGALDRWARPGDVFAVSRVTGEGNRRRAAPLPWTLLEVVDAPRDGTSACRVWTRDERLREGPGILGYRAIRLPTIRGPVRLRVLDEETERPIDGLRIRMWSPNVKPSEVATNRAGLAVSRDEFGGFALAQIVIGSEKRPVFPVALLDDRPVVCR